MIMSLCQCIVNSYDRQHTVATPNDKEVEVKREFRSFVLKDLREKYSQVIERLINIFKRKKVDIPALITILRFDDAEKITIFSTDEAFSKIKTRIELLQHVGLYCKGFYDYEVLDVVINRSNCQEAIRELQDFTKFLHNSILTELNLLSDGKLLHPDDFMPATYKFIIEYDASKCKLETKEMIQTIVQKSVHLQKGVLILKGLIQEASFLYIKSQRL